MCLSKSGAVSRLVSTAMRMASQLLVVTARGRTVDPGSKEHHALLELLVDPQTCGPLLISVSTRIAHKLTCQSHSAWTEIGNVRKS